jgi:hypothetical protein
MFGMVFLIEVMIAFAAIIFLSAIEGGVNA